MSTSNIDVIQSSRGRAICTSSKQDSRRRNAARTRHSVMAWDDREADMQHAHGPLAHTQDNPFLFSSLKGNRVNKAAFDWHVCRITSHYLLQYKEKPLTYYNKMTQGYMFYIHSLPSSALAPCPPVQALPRGSLWQKESLCDLLGAVGHGYRLNSCAPNTGFSNMQGAQ